MDGGGGIVVMLPANELRTHAVFPLSSEAPLHATVILGIDWQQSYRNDIFIEMSLGLPAGHPMRWSYSFTLRGRLAYRFL